MARSKPFLQLSDIGALLRLNAAGVRKFLAAEGIRTTRQSGRLVVTREAWTKWVLRTNERALARLENRR